MNTNFLKEEKKNKGFTLVETLVAIAILSLSILATFTAVQSGLQDSTIAKDRITAFYLVQEGMEFIKNVRDQNGIRNLNSGGVNWLKGLSEVAGDPCYFGKTCKIDSNVGLPLGVTTCSGGFGSCVVLRKDTATGLYGYTAGWPVTNIRREIQFSHPSLSTDEVLVTIRISWTNRGSTKSFLVTQSLFNRY